MWHGGGALENPSNTSQQRIFWGINQMLAEAGYHTVFLDIGQIGGELENAEREAAHLQYVIDRGFGGAVFYPYAYRSNQELIHRLMRNTPLVLIDRRVAPLESDFVSTANYQAMFDMVMHLVEQGHRRIAYVTKCESIQPVLDRTQGYIDAVRHANIDEIILTIPSRLDPTANPDSNWTVIDAVFNVPKGVRPTAAVVFNDYAAHDLFVRLNQLGLSVPGDVALTGFDNIVSSLPGGLGLTTIDQPYEEIGKGAGQLLLRRLKDPSTPFASLEVPGKLIVRDSSSQRREVG
jgi:DNA-binding LacI/PurR family transcriptional regulator